MGHDVSPGMQRYLSYVQAIPRLSREDEHDLAVRVRDAGETGDADALDRLTRANLRYVVAIAIKYGRYRMPLGELVSEGNIGLVVAARKFDPDRGTRFVTYAAHWIRAFMLEHVIRGSSMVGTGSGPMRSKVFFRLRREKAKLVNQGFDSGEVAARLADSFGTTVAKLHEMEERLEARDVSLDTPMYDDGTTTLVDGMASPDLSQEEELSKAEETAMLSERVRDAVSDLDPRERFIVEVRLLADAPSELSLAEIGRRLGVSRERARQIEARAKQKMKKRLLASEADARKAA
jgi:RNA polymerase sigma-32 factor